MATGPGGLSGKRGKGALPVAGRKSFSGSKGYEEFVISKDVALHLESCLYLKWIKGEQNLNTDEEVEKFMLGRSEVRTPALPDQTVKNAMKEGSAVRWYLDQQKQEYEDHGKSFAKQCKCPYAKVRRK